MPEGGGHGGGRFDPSNVTSRHQWGSQRLLVLLIRWTGREGYGWNCKQAGGEASLSPTHTVAFIRLSRFGGLHVNEDKTTAMTYAVEAWLATSCCAEIRR